MPGDAPRAAKTEVAHSQSVESKPSASRDLLTPKSIVAPSGEQVGAKPERKGLLPLDDQKHNMPFGESNQLQGLQMPHQEQRPVTGGQQKEVSSQRNQSYARQAGDILIGTAKDLQESTLPMEHVPKSRELMVVTGNPWDEASWNQKQGKNDLNESGTCSLGASRAVLLQHGIIVSENDLLKVALDIKLLSGEKGNLGLEHHDVPRLVELLGRYGVTAEYHTGGTIQTISRAVEQKRGMLTVVQSELLDEAAYGKPSLKGVPDENHLVTVVGLGFAVKQDAANNFWYNPQHVARVYIADSGTGKVSPIPVTRIMMSWQGRRGMYVLTEPFTTEG